MTDFHTRKTYEEPGSVHAIGSHITDDFDFHFVLDGKWLIVQVEVETSTSGDRGIEESENLAERIVTAVQSWVEDAPTEQLSRTSYQPCDPCLTDDHDNCTGDCPSMCCALAAEVAENARLRAIVDGAGGVVATDAYTAAYDLWADIRDAAASLRETDY